MLGEFFAVLSDDDTRRIPLRRDLQAQLSSQFEAGAHTLIGPDTEIIPLSRAIYTPDEGEAWGVQPFDIPHGLRDAIDNPNGLPDLSEGDISDKTVKAVGARFGDGRRVPHWLALQAMERRRVLSNAGLSIVLDGRIFRRLEEPGLQLSTAVHAVISGDSLVFNRLHWVRRIVSIAQYYREATEEDLDAFVRSDAVALQDEAAFRTNADEWVRRRVALLVDGELFTQCGPRVIKEKAAEYGIPVRTVREGGRERVEVPSSRKEMKNLLKFLSEDIYKGPLTETQYVSTSKRQR